MILVYAFSNQWGTNISHRVLVELQKAISSPEVIFQPVYFHPRQFFNKYIKNNHYDLIIGLGDGGKLLTKIKIETQAKNNYLDKEIYAFSSIFLDLNLPPVDNYDGQYFKIGSNMGIYNCNWIAYSTQLNLNQRNASTGHLFLHLPPRSNAAEIALKIIELIQNNHLFNSNVKIA